MGQLIFSHKMIIPIKQMVDWELIVQKQQKTINKDNICKNSNRLYYDYKVGDNIILNDKAELKYETLHNRPLEIIQCWNNDTVTFKMGVVKIRQSIFRIKPYKSDKNVDD